MKKLLSCIVFIIYLLLGQTERALAQGDPFGSGSLNSLAIATGSRDIFDIVINIVNIVLYFLGGIAVLLGLYAGWLWFTSRGNTEQIKKAKGILVSAVIGLAIIFASYAIANFVVGTLYDNIVGSGGTSGDGDGGDDDGGRVTCPPPDATGTTMAICAISPIQRQVGASVTISGWNFGAYIDAATSRVSFVDGAGVSTDATLVSCGRTPTPYWRQRDVSGSNTSYQVKVIVPEIAVGGPYSIVVHNDTRSASRGVGFVVLPGTPGLNISCLEPDEEGIATDVVAYGKNFGTTGTRTIFMTGWDGAAATQIPVTFVDTDWTDTEIRFRIPDNALASNIIISNDAIVADPSDSEYFKVTCDTREDCASECCSSRKACRPANICSGTVEISGPHINYITPDNAAENNLITIQGSGFGTTAGEVFFTSASSGARPAQVPSDINTACSDLWTDTSIIVGVPNFVAGDGAGTYSVTVQPSGSTVPSAGVSFVVNTTNRPGICLADPISGSLNTPVRITGVGFVNAVGNMVKYGGIDDRNTRITGNTATSNVPNLRTGLVGIQINAGTNLSNPYLFTITEAIAGDPNIVNIDPITGPAGTYLTINGTNFGNSKGASGNVFFDAIPADFSFPLQCSASVWSSGRILVKVPAGLTVDDTYDIKVVRSDGKESNTQEFTATAGTPKPGLCAMFPNNGPKNSLVNFYGDNFGSTAGQIKFYNERNATAGTWRNNMILDAPVPNDAETGPVAVVSSDTQESNALNFRVGSCGSDRDCNTATHEFCCKNTIGNYCALNCSNTRMCTYGWNFLTVPTPTTELEVMTKWPACDSSCGNSQIGVGFNVLLDDVSATLTTNYTITDVTPVGERVATESYDPVTINSVTLTENEGASIPAKVVLNYAGTLQLKHLYRVTVGMGVLSYEFEHLVDPAGIGYFWEFRVGQGICLFTGVNIDPANYTASRPSQSIGYDATPTADVSTCGAQRLTCSGCTYNWTINTPAIASWNTRTPDGNRGRTAVSTPNRVPSIITGTDNVQCRITQGTNTASGRTSLSIDYAAYLQSLRVTSHYPDCGAACLNAVVGMHFNTPLIEGTANTNNIKIIDVGTGTEVQTGVIPRINDISRPNSESVWEISHIPFETGRTYRVTISTAVQNTFTNHLVVPFEWDFTVGVYCAVTGADVTPDSDTTTVGQGVPFFVETTSNTDSCGYMPVSCSACAYNWGPGDPAVATISGTGKSARAMGVSTGDTTINCSVAEGARAMLPVASDLTVTGPTYLAPHIEDNYNPQPPGVTAQCRNTAIEITFSEKMNLDSIRNNLKLYNSSDVEISGTYAFATVDGPDVDLTNNETKVVFSPTEILAASSQYRISVGAGIVSLNNQSIDFSFTPLLEPSLEAWTFTTGTEICKISYVRTNPNEDWFTCGGNTCERDDVATTDGNQHYYSATAYSRENTPLSSSGLTYNWISLNPEIVSLINNTAIQTTATAGKNGQTPVSVTVSGTIAGVSLGSANASLPVTVFLCQNPWPGLSSFPWIEGAFNFSTYYCQQFTEGSPILPYLGTPISSTHANTILEEYIFTVNINSATSKNNSMGSLAYFLPISQEKEQNVWQRISALMQISQAQGQSMPLPVVNPPTSVTAVADGNSVTIHWSLPRVVTGIASYRVERRLSGTTDWALLRSFPASGAPTSYIDSSVPDGRYDYRVTSVDGDPDGSPASSALQVVVVSATAVSETNFIIFRVMPNTGHLSVKEWYKEKFPGDAVGTMSTVDGYEAMRVGNTTYISAANISGSSIYTNIYIIAYSLGANAQTKNIYDQLVANFQLNTNSGFSTTNDNNLCSPTDPDDGVVRVCSTNFDCPSGTICRSKSLKLRRDVKRLTDLLPIKKYLEQYGSAHMACSGNAQISCTSTGGQCGALGPCVNYYPQLNAGTFVRGQSNSKWPLSWQQTLSTDLKQTLPVDPINKFSVCPISGSDPETCWKEATREFRCAANSNIYGYKLEDLGKDYQLYSNFEYDAVSSGFGTFVASLPRTGLYNGPEPILSGVNNLGNISTTLDSYCTGSPTLPGSNTCGNGQVEPATEECDGGFRDNQCDFAFGNQNWWNEQVTGCNPPGTPNECHWYVPTLTREMCGGYCGDTRIQASYENCDSTATPIVTSMFHCPITTAGTYGVSNVCNSSCNMVCPDGLPAAKCGDGVWTPGREACDSTGSPNGLSGWDCPNNGNLSCNPPSPSVSSCNMRCDNGTNPYFGFCGDGIVQWVCSNNRSLACVNDGECGSGTCVQVESCDYADYDTPLPSAAFGDHRYTCSPSCTFDNQPYCGDSIIQPTYREQCDTTLLVTPRPNQSSNINQYQCRMTNDPTITNYTRCTKTEGGFCGDNTRQAVYGELCDGTDYPGRPTPEESSETNTYDCADSCLASDPNGGYCGDSRVQTSFGEDCDLGVSPAQKNVELVFVFDVSRSLAPAATALCGALNQVFTSPLAGVNYKITVFSMADDVSSATNQGFLSNTTNDDLRTLADQTCTSNDGDSTRLSACEHRRVFDALVADCPAYRNFNNPATYTNLAISSLRYLSFYDNGSNNITGGVISATTGGNDNGTNLNYCTDESVTPGGRLENWGYAIKRINENYNWLTGYQRIVIPVSDEYAWCGGATAAAGGAYDPPKNNEDFSAESGANTADVLRAAVNSAHAARPNIHISPVILRNGGYPGDATTNAWGMQNQLLGRAIANDTGGMAITTYDNWNATLIRVINSAFCDGNGDGTMDCSFP